MEQYAVIWVNGDKALKERKDVNFLRQFEFSAEAMRRAEDSKERQRKSLTFADFAALLG